MPRLRTSLPTALLAGCTVLAGVGGLGLSTAESATAVAPTLPRPPGGLPSGIESLARYVPATSCDAHAKAGTVAFAALLKSATGVNSNIPRNCGADALSTSEHYDGRAVDYFVSSRSATSRAKANAVIAWLLATDSKGQRYANARRLGVMYIIWNGKIWGAYRPSDGWREYSGCSKLTRAAYDTTCHRNHMHLSLSWEGAHKRTSWWTKRVARPEYGPCRVSGLNWAPPRSTPNYTPCPNRPRVSAVSSAPALGRTLVAYSGMYLALGSAGPIVKAVQSAIGTPADGGFGPATRTALAAWQRRAGVPATGRTDATTWRALIRRYLPGGSPGGGTSRSTPGRPGRGLDGDNVPDLLARRGDGTLWLYPGTGRGSVRHGRKIASGWGIYRDFFSPGDFTGDGRRDVLARDRSGRLFLYRGNGRGGLASRHQVGRGWGSFTQVFSPGDFTGDGKADVLARDRAGRLFLYRGNGSGGFVRGRRLASTGWRRFTHVVSSGDVTGDRRADLLATTRTGRLYLYPGTGKGRLVTGRVIGHGWQGFNLLAGAGDLTGDGRADLVARNRAGVLSVYAGTGKGHLRTPARRVGAGWHTLNRITGVR